MLKTQPNERRCADTIVTHILSLPQCCPITGNPQAGSTVEIVYTPTDLLIEVISLRDYVDSYQGGRGDVRSMEGMIQSITQDCFDLIGVLVEVKARLKLFPDQDMVVDCAAWEH